jgi:hypothetical protein
MSEAALKKIKVAEGGPVRIAVGGKMQRYCRYILGQLGGDKADAEPQQNHVEIQAEGACMARAVSVAELVKRTSLRPVRQTTHIADKNGQASISIILAV